MKKEMVQKAQVWLPERIRAAVGDRELVSDDVGMSEACVLTCGDMVLKIQPDGEEGVREYQMLQWLKGKAPVPDVLEYERQAGKTWLLMSRAPGQMSCETAYIERPELLIRILAEGLRALWSIDISDCPYRSDLDVKLKSAERNVECGLVDMENVQPDTFGEDGFQNPQELLSWLTEHRPPEELVFSHGDYCLPNVFASGEAFSALIDLGRAGVADRWQDIALAYRSLRDNLSGKYSGMPVNPDFPAERLFDELGLEPDYEKIRYYILLDELF